MKRLLLLLIIILAFVTGQAAPGWCGTDVAISARPGLEGMYKVNRPVLISVDVDNRGERVAGRLVLVSRAAEGNDVPNRFNGAEYGCEVDVPAGQKASYTMVVPGEVVSSASYVRLVSGKQVLAETGLDGVGVGGAMVIMPVSEKFLGSSMFTWLDKKYGGQVMVKYLPAGNLPDKALFLQPADVIVADRESVSSIGDGRKKVLLEWVRLGGRLLLSGQSSVEPGGPFEGLLQLDTGGSGQTGIVVREPLGKGEIIVVRTPVEGITDREGRFWEDSGVSSWAEGLFTGNKITESQNDKNILVESGSYLPLARTVGIPVLIALWLVYVIIVGPGIYMVLKKFNRRDLAWLAVPAVAVVTAAGLFTLSPTNRLKAYISYSVSAVDIVDKNLAEVKTIGSFVLPRGGTLEVAGQGGMLLDSLNNYARQSGNTVAVLSGSDPRVVFKGVEYGSMRQVYSYGTMTVAGTMGGTVFFRGDRVSGRISNNTPYDLSDCRLLVGKSLIELDSIPAGGSRDLDEPLGSALVLGDPIDAYRVEPRSPVQLRERMLVSEYAAQRSFYGEVIFMGWSGSSVTGFRVISPSGQGQESGRTLIRQKMTISFPEGAFKLPAGYIKSTVTGLGGGYGQSPEGLFINSGAVKITYDLAGTLNTNKYTVTGIEVPPLGGDAGYKVEIFNQAASRWETVEAGNPAISGKEAQDYISGKGTVEIRLTAATINDKPVREDVFRGISVEGVIGS